MALVGPFNSGTATSATLDQALTSILTVHTKNYNRLFVRVTASVQAFDQFQISARCITGSTNAIIANASSEFTTPVRPLLGASGNLAALSGATGWFYMEVEGIIEVDVAIAFAVDNGTYVIEYSVQ